MATNSTTTTRRSALAAIGAAGLIGAMPAVATVATYPASETGWRRVVALYRASCEAVERFDVDIHVPALNACDTAWKAIPHYTTSASYLAHDGDRRHLSTDNDISVAVAKSMRDQWETFGPNLAEYVGTYRELLTAHEKREAEKERLSNLYNTKALFARADELADASSRALDAVAEYPVTTLAQLAEKMEVIEEDHGIHVEDHWLALKADVRRLLSGEG